MILVVVSMMRLSHPRVNVLDSRFRVQTAKISKGTNHTIYLGHQLEGRLRDWLRGVGIKVAPVRQDTTTTQTETCAFMIRYTGDLPHDDLCEVRAALSDGTGKEIPLQWFTRASAPKTKNYFSVWVVDPPATNIKDCHLRLTLGTNGLGLADIAVGGL